MEWFDWIYDPSAWIALLTLTFLEIVLGIDNIVFVSILTGRLPAEQRSKGRRIGLLLAMGMRIALLFSIRWVMGLKAPWFTVFEHTFAGRDLILLGGGLFLIWKSTTEIHHKLEGADEGEHDDGGASKVSTFGSVLAQIALLDIVFSLDSVITAVGMAQDLAVMVIAVLISVGVMMVFVNPICRFVEQHPTVKMLALSFLLLIGFTLVAEAFHQEIPKGYIYFAMAFSVMVEFLNLRLRKTGKPVNLRGPAPGSMMKPAP
jgi:predicted tellurium resistance membrane protein TerC